MKKNIITKLVFILIILLLFNFIVIQNSVFADNLEEVGYPPAPSEYEGHNFNICNDGAGSTWLLIGDSSVNSFKIINNHLYAYSSSNVLQNFFCYRLVSGSWSYGFTSSSGIDAISRFTFYYSSLDILSNNQVFFAKNIDAIGLGVIYPYIVNSQEGLANLDIDNLLINYR